jgi:hypothetical protein
MSALPATAAPAYFEIALPRANALTIIALTAIVRALAGVPRTTCRSRRAAGWS